MSDQENRDQTSAASAEQMMKQLDLEIAARRARRTEGKPNRAVALAGAIILILAAALGALLFLQQMLSGLPRQNRENLRGTPVGHSQ